MDQDRRKSRRSLNRLISPPHGGATNGTGVVAASPTSLSADQFGYLIRSAFRQHWRRALTLGLIVATLAVAVFLVVAPPTYEAYGLLRVVPTVPRLVFEAPDSGARDFYETYRQTQASLVTSPEVLSAALKRPGVRDLPAIQNAADPVAWLSNRITVEALRDTELLRVALAMTDNASAQTLVNAVVDSYMEQVVEGVDADRAKRMALLEQQRETWGKELERKQKRLRELGEQVGTIDNGALGEKQQAMLSRFVKAQSELTRVQLARLAAEADLATLESQLQHDEVAVPEEVVEEALHKDSQVAFFEKALANVDYELNELKQRIRDPNDVAIVQLKLKRKLLTQSLGQRKDELRPEVAEQRRQAIVAEIKQKAAESKQQIVQLAEQQRVLEDMVQEEQVAADRIGQASLDIRFLLDDLKRIEKVHDQVVARLDELRVESKAPGRVTVMARADLPESSYHPTRRYIVASTLGILGFSVVQFVIFGLAVCHPRVGSPEELAVTARIPVFGTLPRFTRGDVQQGGAILPAALPSHREYESAVDSLRAALLLDRRRPVGGFAVAVTSAARGEGKSTLAAHLAASAARVGKRVLLVDADLHHGSLHKLFSRPVNDGLVQVLQQGVSVDLAIQTTCVPGLDLLTAGAPSAKCSVALQDERFQRFVADANEHYDLVVVDTAPVLAEPDALYVGRASELTLLSVLCDESQQALVEQAHERLLEVGVHVRGAVLHGARGGAFSAANRPTRQHAQAVRSRREPSNGAATPTGLN